MRLIKKMIFFSFHDEQTYFLFLNVTYTAIESESEKLSNFLIKNNFPFYHFISSFHSNSNKQFSFFFCHSFILVQNKYLFLRLDLEKNVGYFHFCFSFYLIFYIRQKF